MKGIRCNCRNTVSVQEASPVNCMTLDRLTFDSEKVVCWEFVNTSSSDMTDSTMELKRACPGEAAIAHWQSGYTMQPVLNDSSMESASMDENEDQEHWQPQGPSRTPSWVCEARSRIRQQKILQKSLISRSKHQASLLDASKHAQVLVEALEAAQTQQQEVNQVVLEFQLYLHPPV